MTPNPNYLEVVMAENTQNKVGRPEKWTKERCEALVKLSKETGRTLKALAAERHVPYITVITALKRHGLSPRPRKAVEPLAA